MKLQRILYSNNSAWSIFNFRVKLLSELKKNNYEIYVLCPWDNRYSKKLMELGFQVTNINFDNSNSNLLRQLKLFFDYIVHYRGIKPDIILHNAAMPNIYGSIAASILRIKTINNISGLGSGFLQGGFKLKIMNLLYRFSQRGAGHIFFQNKDDMQFFLDNNLIKYESISLLPGSGVDLNRFNPKKRSFNKSESSKICFVGRIIKDKGILDYINAIKLLKEKKIEFEAFILGELYQNQTSSVSKFELKTWIKEGLVKHLDKVDNVEDFIGEFDCIVLPSYREGMARVLLEAAGTGVPIIATNVPGCKDIVIDGENGFLCEPKNPESLSRAIEKLLILSKEERIEMGNNGRKLIEDYFDELDVIKEYQKVITGLLDN